MRKSIIHRALTDFEIGILVLSFIATLAWVYLVLKISAVLDSVQKSFATLLTGGT